MTTVIYVTLFIVASAQALQQRCPVALHIKSGEGYIQLEEWQRREKVRTDV